MRQARTIRPTSAVPTEAQASLLDMRIVEKAPLSPTPTEVGSRHDRFPRNSTSQFRRAVRDALDLTLPGYPKGRR